LKPVYTIFSHIIFLNIIAIFTILTSLQMTYYFILNLVQGGWNYYFIDLNFIILIAYLLLLVFDVWILTGTLLPIIKIDDFGITAYSIFWRRALKWEELKACKLLKLSAGHSHSTMSVSWAVIQSPINKGAWKNKGLRVNTFILLHKHKFKMPEDLSLKGLLSHNKIVDKDGIAFEYNHKAWLILQEKLDLQNNPNYIVK
jgi:hypothetical protein